MADYVSKYTGSEVDGILEDAIELPQGSSEDVGKFLKYTGDTHPVEWDSIKELPAYGCGDYIDSILTVRYSNGENVVEWYAPQYGDEGKFLKYGSNGIEWGDPIDTSDATDGQVLKYAGGTHNRIEWGDPIDLIDTSEANDGDFLKYNGNSLEWGNPFPSSPDAGDVLKYNGNDLEWGGVFPSYGQSGGRYLKYSSNTGVIWDDVFPSPSNQCFLKFTSNTGLCWASIKEIPDGASDGLVLKAGGSGNLGWDLPIKADNVTAGLVLTTDGQGSYGWQEIIPSYDSTGYDQGKVLGIDEYGQLAWMAPSAAQTLYDSQNNS